MTRLLQKYPWLIQELYNQEQESSSRDYHKPTKKDEPEMWLPRRQWGREGDLWSRRRRDASGLEAERFRGRHLHRKVQAGTRKERTGKRKDSVRSNLPQHHKSNTNSHNVNKNLLQRTDHHRLHTRGRYVEKFNHNSKLDKHLASSRARRPLHRTKRHAGSHDAGGVMRLISTGSLAPPIDNVDSSKSIDLIFAMYWFYPNDREVSIA